MFFSEKVNAVLIEIGNGDIQVRVKGGKLPDKSALMVVTFKPLENPQEVGTEVTDENESNEKGFGFLIHNIEGLAVIEKALAVCRKKMTASEAK